MSENWRNLKMGDRIRFLRMPPIFDRHDFHVSQETLDLYELLIATGDAMEIDQFIDGVPHAGYVDNRIPERPVLHGLAIDDTDEGCWEFVSDNTQSL